MISYVSYVERFPSRSHLVFRSFATEYHWFFCHWRPSEYLLTFLLTIIVKSTNRRNFNFVLLLLTKIATHAAVETFFVIDMTQIFWPLPSK